MDGASPFERARALQNERDKRNEDRNIVPKQVRTDFARRENKHERADDYSNRQRDDYRGARMGEEIFDTTRH
ncbi:MAG: hypothetical protein HY741_14790 [Chloroflexi bacterium]|nr:hypothetical protein [Chloroflexota bacterium]